MDHLLGEARAQAADAAELRVGGVTSTGQPQIPTPCIRRREMRSHGLGERWTLRLTLIGRAGIAGVQIGRQFDLE